MDVKKFFFILILSVVLVFFNIGSVYAKYVFEYNFEVADISIDNVPPRFEFLDFANNNKYCHEAFSDKHTIKIFFDLFEKNIKYNKLDIYNDANGWVTLYRDGVPFTDFDSKLYEILVEKDMIRYELILTNVKGDGNISFEIFDNIVGDFAGNGNKKYFYDLNLRLDNKLPVVNMSNEKLPGGKVKVKLHSNEKLIKDVNWNVNDNMLDFDKDFRSNVSYPYPVIDLAGHQSVIDINVTGATDIYTNFVAINEFSSYDLNEFNENNHIFGKKSYLENCNNKIELIGMYSSGNIPKDYLQMRTFLYTFKGLEDKGSSPRFNVDYNFGYNPKQQFGSALYEGHNAVINGKNYFLLGSDGVNSDKGIRPELLELRKYGLSGIELKLKDEKDYSIIYQIYLHKYGWWFVEENGNECFENHSKAFSCFRYAIIPNTEKNYLVNYWNSQTGTKI